MKQLILGTAGHIDHGKTALVKALTGVDTDRLPEEKQRGITIDLGFANLRIGDCSFGIVDVPGHEDFIRNMLAGATGMDAVLLVVAADEGIMPQTREHLAILDLLDVRAGVVAITKSDLAESGWVDLVVDDVQQALATTSLSNAPIVRVSSRTGDGLDELRSAIVQQANQPGGRDPDDLLRLPIDRVFTVRGTGTVVTGTVWSGSVRIDETLRILPGDFAARVRGIEVHGEGTQRAEAGQRAAIALSGVDKATLSRGDVLLRDAVWQPTHILTARVRMIADTKWQLRSRQRVRVHLGTAEVLARIVVLDDGMVQFRLESPLVARAKDRIVIRSYSPVTTIAGGEVVETNRKRSAVTPVESELLGALDVAAVLQIAGGKGCLHAELPLRTGLAPNKIEVGAGTVRIGERWFSNDVVERVVNAVVANVNALHAANPLRPTLDRSEVRSTLREDGELVDHAIDQAVARGLLQARMSEFSRTGFQPWLSTKHVALKRTLLEEIRAAGLTPPSVEELSEALGSRADVPALLRLLVHEGSLVAVGQNLYMDVVALQEAQSRTREAFAEDQKLSAADFRAALPVSRKHLIPLLEYFDKTGVTHREGDVRVVLPVRL